jgi:hypothetical protein
VYFGVAWFFEDHKIGHVLPAFKDMLSGDGMVDKGNLGVEHRSLSHRVVVVR